jgi:hypothetical protein
MAKLVNESYPGIEYPYFKVVGPVEDGRFVKMVASDEVALVDAQANEAIGVMIETFLPHEYYNQAADEKLRCAVMVGQSVLDFTSWSGTIVTGDDVSFDPTDGRPRAAISGDTIYGKCVQHSDSRVRVLLYGHGIGTVA